MTLKSRYGETWELSEIPGGYLWKDIPAYTRFGLFPDSEDEYCFIDPPGGPFLEVGREIRPGEVIVTILENENKEVIIKTNKKEED